MVLLWSQKTSQSSEVIKSSVLTSQDDGRLLLEGTITDTLELRWWLASFGSRAEVVEPDELRQHFVKEAELLIERYQ